MAQLSRQVTLGAGDLIYTGTPAGVGPVVPGDLIAAHIDGLPLAHHHHHVTRGMTMLPTERIAYSPITDRPPLKLPGGARMAVWVIVNVEEWDTEQTMPRTVLTPPAGGSPMPDIPNWAWHEYGNRVGFWRMLKVFDEFQIPGVLAINGSRASRPTRRSSRRRSSATGSSSATASPSATCRRCENEHEDIRKTTEAISKATGKPPRGWLGPGLTETWETPDLLKEDGYDYVADWVLDDQPVWLKTRAKPIVNMPYTQECNDVAMMLIQHHKASEYYDRAIDQFEQIYADAAKSRARDGAGGASLHHGRAAPAEILPQASSRTSGRSRTSPSGPASRFSTGTSRSGPKAP